MNHRNLSKRPAARPTRSKASRMAPKHRQLPMFLMRNSIPKVEGASVDDLIIPIMGVTGVGKSSFVNTILGRQASSVGFSVESCTKQIEHFFAPHPSDSNPGRRILFVDTPGFDDTYLDDAEIFKQIAFWLGRSYHDGIKIAGIIYLHDITQDSLVGLTKNLEIFKRLCGHYALKNVAFVTTKWTKVGLEEGRRKEQMLKDKPWRGYDSQVMRFCDTKESAWAIVNNLLTPPIAAETFNLRIQQELVDLQRYLPETDAGKSLYQDLHKQLGYLKRELADLGEVDSLQDDSSSQERYREKMERVDSIVKQIQEVRVPLSQKALRFFGLTGSLSSSQAKLLLRI